MIFILSYKLLTKQLNNVLITLKLQQHTKQHVVQALRSKKRASENKQPQYFLDTKYIRTLGGKGGDGCISFLSLWANEYAGPDGGDGGNGGHVVFETSLEVNNFSHLQTVTKAENGEKGMNKDCCGKNANHNIIKVPVGTVVRNAMRKIVGDLNQSGRMFIAARGGSGGKGNAFFVTDTQQAPEICEYGANGEDLTYELELRSMAQIGLIGLPNAGKSTLLRAISRARPKVAPYPFTTLKPHIGMVQYSDYEQLAVADLPGLISGSHQNKGLGIQFLRHAERCAALLFIIDVSLNEPWSQYETLRHELKQFSKELLSRPQIIVANKIDLPEAMENVDILRQKYPIPLIEISAKYGTNVGDLLKSIRIMYDQFKQQH